MPATTRQISLTIYMVFRNYALRFAKSRISFAHTAELNALADELCLPSFSALLQVCSVRLRRVSVSLLRLRPSNQVSLHAMLLHASLRATFVFILWSHSLFAFLQSLVCAFLLIFLTIFFIPLHLVVLWAFGLSEKNGNY